MTVLLTSRGNFYMQRLPGNQPDMRKPSRATENRDVPRSPADGPGDRG